MDRHRPDLRIEAHWDGRRASVFLNWSGPPLHERGYRRERTEAALRETTAALVLAMAGWPFDDPGAAFVDPVCGSGTFLVEAAMMAVDAPPGIHRSQWGFEAWSEHDDELWQSLRRDAVVRYGESLEKLPTVWGYDRDENALKAARSNLRRAGMQNLIRLDRHDITQGLPERRPFTSTGLMGADPPYGHRSDGDPTPIYTAIGNAFRTLPEGWRLALLAPDRQTAAASCLRADAYHATVSGGLDVVLALYSRVPGSPATEKSPGRPAPSGAPRPPSSPKPPKPPAPVPASRREREFPPDPKAPSVRKILRRNLEALGNWAAKTGVSSYRIWDADLPEFNAAVDWYERRWLHVQEFAAPSKVPAAKARRRLETLVEILREETDCPPERLYLKTRRRGVRPYARMDETGEKFIIRENGARFFVNFTDYLDTGIFLDHRPTRKLIRDAADGRRFLNLFCYTGTATVMAALGGASATASVDVSRTYLDWTRDNMRLNGVDGPHHRYHRSDAFSYLKTCDEAFDLIFIDPPTYSNGAGREDWSVQEHHGALIREAMTRLNPEGRLLFSENFRRFRLEPSLEREYSVTEITRDTLHPDFARRGRSHRCWEFSLS